MKPQTDVVSSRVALTMAVVVASVAVAMWLPSVSTPFWGDDYFFLEDAFRARHEGEGWWAPFWPHRPYQFWRPLGHETYWRFVESVLTSDPRLAHAANFVLWGGGCLCVGVFATVLSHALRWERPAITGAMATAVYAVLALHFTPLHWTSSADSLFIVIWSALALAAWTGLSRCRPGARLVLCACLPLLQLVALFSKESAVVIPPLMLCVTVFLRKWKWHPVQLVAFGTCVVVIAVWLYVRPRFVFAPPVEYELRSGLNVLRNLAALTAWLLNVPREALRMFVIGPRYDALFWIMAAAVPMGMFLLAACSVLKGRMPLRSTIALVAFVMVAYAPYILLNWQSYEYYAEVAAIAPAAVVAHAAAVSRRVTMRLGLLCLSTIVAVEGSRMVGYPALIARANIAEAQIDALVYREMIEPGLDDMPLTVRTSNEHEFYALGRAGLTWRLGRIPIDVAVGDGCIAETSRVLEIRDADLWLADCMAESSLEAF